VALLASEVLVMSRLGTSADGVLKHQGFHVAFNKDVLALEGTAHIPGLRELDELWNRFEKYLRQNERGALGSIAFFEVIKYTHINYPASQCVVRVSDRRRLHGLFRRHFDPGRSLGRDELMQLFDADTTGLSVMFRRAYEQLDDYPDLAQAFWSIVEGEYAVWRAEPEQVIRIARDSARNSEGRYVGRLRSISNAASAAAYVSGAFASGPAEQEVPARIRAMKGLPSIPLLPSRIVLVEPYRRPAALFAEVREATDKTLAVKPAETEISGWTRLLDPIDAEMLEEGFERFLGGFRIRQAGRAVVIFELGDRAWVESNMLKINVPLRLVCSVEYAQRFSSLRSLATTFAELAIDAPGLCCFAITLSVGVSRDDLPPALSDALSTARTKISFVSGLRLRNGMFLEEGPPLILFAHQEEERATVFLNDAPVGIAERDIPYRLPADVGHPGRQVVRILDHARAFFSCDAAAEEHAAADAPESGLGFVAASHPPRLETRLDAEELRIEDLSKMGAVVVVGAEVLLPYKRTIE
jgi:hypothetical protein